MIPVLTKTVLRSVLVGLAAAVCLRAFDIRNMFTQEAGLGLVLTGALAMPLLAPITQRLHFQPASSSIVSSANSMTLLQELQAMLQARSGSGLLPTRVTAPIRAPDSPQTEKCSFPAPGSAPASHDTGPSGSEPAQGQAESGTNGI
ncbi:MAG TPA: hypothetical protein VK574_10830 [Terracidiphilus sp.]|nr:hypothetical protein [Terracidiphilus sp.]